MQGKSIDQAPSLPVFQPPLHGHPLLPRPRAGFLCTFQQRIRRGERPRGSERAPRPPGAGGRRFCNKSLWLAQRSRARGGLIAHRALKQAFSHAMTERPRDLCNRVCTGPLYRPYFVSIVDVVCGTNSVQMSPGTRNDPYVIYRTKLY